MGKSQEVEVLHLHDRQIHRRRAILNRTYIFFNILALLLIFYYRIFKHKHYDKDKDVPLLPCLVMFAAELLQSFLWIIRQPMYWRPLTRTVNLPLSQEMELPGLDVFICTADPNKEPTLEVMNTVISAMSLDYPANKLNVYVSDDGGASVTLNAIKEAWVFATWWLPFCKRFNIKPICPQAFFQNPQPHCYLSQTSRDFNQHRDMIKEKYETFKHRLHNWKGAQEIDRNTSAQDHPPTIQVINEILMQHDNGATINPQGTNMPFLVYVAREKRPAHPNHFKAGALNVLQRVSSIFSNSAYILVLDCDMYCNDSISARQAMCFYLDSNISSSLAWVQFPQKFRNISDTDIYDSQMRLYWPVLYPGMDGLQGPLLSGTNFYINRKALYGFPIDKNDNDIMEQRYNFGSSKKLAHSLCQTDKPNAMKIKKISSEYLQEAHYLASCAYEYGVQRLAFDTTQWWKM